MTIKIFNDDPKYYAFPVYTTGQHKPPAPRGDIWLQAIFKNTAQQIKSGQFNYYSNQSYRFYLTGGTQTAPVGIPPNGNVTLTIPLYTQLAASPNPNLYNQYADWWNGATIQLYYSDSATPPAALTSNFNSRSQKPLVSQAASKVFPSCVGCGGLKFVWDSADLPISDPSQLLEMTLAARAQQCDLLATTGDQVCKPNQVPDNLDLHNVDFDVSYVNVAYGPAAMGPYNNKQVGYVGSPQLPEVFTKKLTDFLKSPAGKGWPQFINNRQIIAKIPSPLEIFTRLSGPLPPPDLTPPQNAKNWPQPDSLWPPVSALYANWIKYAGKIGGDGDCKSDTGDFCKAITGVKQLMLANYKKYITLFGTGKPCGSGKPAPLTDNLMVAHVYGWTPFIENGCPADANLLQNTPTYNDNNYEKYSALKKQYDDLNYQWIPNSKYVFNPWVDFIHNQAGVTNAYAYSVDDAVGNVQADGDGIIIDISSLKHLENQLPADQPIDISYGLLSPSKQTSFTHYSVCDNTHWTPVKPWYSAFIINANKPENCPVYMRDSKSKLYTFTVATKPKDTFPVRTSSATQIWDTKTAAPIKCTGNASYPASSRQFCCDLTNKAGIKAFQTPVVNSAHKAVSYSVVMGPPIDITGLNPPNDVTCSQGVKWP